MGRVIFRRVLGKGGRTLMKLQSIYNFTEKAGFPLLHSLLIVHTGFPLFTPIFYCSHQFYPLSLIGFTSVLITLYFFYDYSLSHSLNSLHHSLCVQCIVFYGLCVGILYYWKSEVCVCLCCEFFFLFSVPYEWWCQYTGEASMYLWRRCKWRSVWVLLYEYLNIESLSVSPCIWVNLCEYIY